MVKGRQVHKVQLCQNCITLTDVNSPMGGSLCSPNYYK